LRTKNLEEDNSKMKTRSSAKIEIKGVEIKGVLKLLSFWYSVDIPPRVVVQESIFMFLFSN